MSVSDSSSEDDCLYVNAASKLHALNHRNKSNIDDDDDDDDDEDNDNEMICEPQENITKTGEIDIEPVNNRNENVIHSNSEDSKSKDDVECTDVTTVDEQVILVGDASDCDSSPPKKGRYSRNRARINNAAPLQTQKNSTENNVVIVDDIENEMNNTFDDSFNLSQDDSYICIGSPPPTKKKDNDNYEVNVKVKWRSNKVERFEIKRYESFQKIFSHFAKLEGVSEDQILIMKKDKKISPFDSPVSIDWSIIDILDGGIVSAGIANKNKGSVAQLKAQEAQENNCKIKVQASDKRTLTITLKNDESFASLLHACSEQLNISKSKIKFYFDGDVIDTDETPESLDIEDEACFDLKISK